MIDEISDFAKLGLVYHMLHPKCMLDPDYHAHTLAEFALRSDMETFDYCLPYGDQQRKIALEALNNSSMEKVYALHFFPAKKISLGSLSPIEQAQARLLIEDQIDMAIESGATGFVFPSGADVPKKDRARARMVFAEFCKWFCGKLKEFDMTAYLEPFDRTFDKKYLYGPTLECVELIDSLYPQVDNLQLELDIAHIKLMEEDFRSTFEMARSYLGRVHLGNCVKQDPLHPWYGDTHPPIGLEGGEIDVPELVEVLDVALDIGYLNRENPGALVIEAQPFPQLTEEETIIDNMERLNKAWNVVQRNRAFTETL